MQTKASIEALLGLWFCVEKAISWESSVEVYVNSRTVKP